MKKDVIFFSDIHDTDYANNFGKLSQCKSPVIAAIEKKKCGRTFTIFLLYCYRVVCWQLICFMDSVGEKNNFLFH